MGEGGGEGKGVTGRGQATPLARPVTPLVTREQLEEVLLLVVEVEAMQWVLGSGLRCFPSPERPGRWHYTESFAG